MTNDCSDDMEFWSFEDAHLWLALDAALLHGFLQVWVCHESLKALKVREFASDTDVVGPAGFLVHVVVLDAVALPRGGVLIVVFLPGFEVGNVVFDEYGRH